MELKTERIYLRGTVRGTASATLLVSEIIRSYVYGPNPFDPEQPLTRDHYMGNHHGWSLNFEVRDGDGAIYFITPTPACDFPTQAMADAFHLKLFDGSLGPLVDLETKILWFIAAAVAAGEWIPPEGESAWEGYRLYLPVQEDIV